jgi:hypothetical protein
MPGGVIEVENLSELIFMVRSAEALPSGPAVCFRHNFQPVLPTWT